MNKRFSPVFFLFFLFLLYSLSACHKDDDTIQTFQGKTVLIYMVADNSLNAISTTNIDSMVVGFSRSKTVGQMVIYLDNESGIPSLIQLVKDSNGGVTQRVVKTYAEQNSADVAVMSGIFSDVMKLFPSTSYGLVLWSHGYGWLPGTTSTKASSLRWFGQDGSYNMNISDLGTALKSGPRFDYVLFDACFMGGVETAYALRSCTGYLIASPAEVLTDGFPYGVMVSYLFGSTEADYIKAASLYYDHYNALSGSNQSASVACIKCSELDSLAVEFGNLIGTHIDDLNVFNASSVQPLDTYSPHLFYDLGHFISCFTTEEERASFERQLDKTVVYKVCTPNILSMSSDGYTSSFSVSHYSGLNTYIPQSSSPALNVSYLALEWSTTVGWNKTKW
jgi:hypothetical protein